MITLYGIKNCDTVKKARKWLEDTGVEHRFHDFRKDGFDKALVERLASALGHEAMMNTRGTTWRKLPDDAKSDMNEAKAIDLMAAHDALIKRPVWERDGDYRLGFAAKDLDAFSAWVK